MLKFGSWSYHGFALDLQPESELGMDTSEYLENGEWDLLCEQRFKIAAFYE